MNAYGTIITGDALTMLRTLPDRSVQCCVTSPPYWGLRDYGVPGQIGLEKTPEQYVDCLTEVLAEVWRVLRWDGTLWLNLADIYANDNKWGGKTGGKHAHGLHGQTGIGRRKTATGLLPKNLVGIPWRVAFVLQDMGWYLRSDIIWHKPNPMPESVKDRPTRAHEYLFLLSKSERYYYDHEAVREPTAAASGQGRTQSPLPLSWNRLVKEPERSDQRYSQPRITKRHSVRPGIDAKGGNQGRGEITYSRYTRNRRSVWNVATRPFPDAHFATFPPELVRPCILAGCPAGGVVLDPFFGAGTTGVVCVEKGRRYLGIEINPDYVGMAQRRIEAAEVKARVPMQTSLLQSEAE